MAGGSQADLRKEKQESDDLLRNTCFICGLSRIDFESAADVTFEEHIHKEHNLWSYVNFIVRALCISADTDVARTLIFSAWSKNPSYWLCRCGISTSCMPGISMHVGRQLLPMRA